MKILAVDDDESILAILKEALTVSDGRHVATALSGAEALEIVKNDPEPFDCFLLDIQMPELDGIELCRILRANPRHRTTPIIMVTAMSEKSYIDHAFTVGATDYVTKPLDFLELETRINLARNHRVQTAESAAALVMANAANAAKRSAPGAVPLGEPFEVTGVSRAIGYIAFENYILQLTKSYLFFSSVYAIKIAGIEEIHSQCSGDEFQTLISRSTRMISDCTVEAGNLLSYRGNGVFLCIRHNNSKPSQSELSELLQDQIEAEGKRNDAPTYLREMTFLVGEPVSLGLLSRAATLNSLRKAVDKVETRTVVTVPSPQEIAPRQPVRRKEPTFEERKSDYEMLLRQSLREDIRALDIRQPPGE